MRVMPIIDWIKSDCLTRDPLPDCSGVARQADGDELGHKGLLSGLNGDEDRIAPGNEQGKSIKYSHAADSRDWQKLGLPRPGRYA